jgi:hypothetical protein
MIALAIRFGLLVADQAAFHVRGGKAFKTSG